MCPYECRRMIYEKMNREWVSVPGSRADDVADVLGSDIGTREVRQTHVCSGWANCTVRVGRRHACRRRSGSVRDRAAAVGPTKMEMTWDMQGVRRG